MSLIRRVGLLSVQVAIVLLCVGVTSWIALTVQERDIRESTEERVLAVAQSLASLDDVVAALELPQQQGTAELQPLADLIQGAAGVDYVVFARLDGVRLTHPNPDERGRELSTDHSEVREGETFIGTEAGTLGSTLRAKVPIRADGDVVGTISVGIAESSIVADIEEILGAVLPWTLGAVVIGAVASGAVTHMLQRRLRRMQSDVRELAVQRRIGAALREQTHEFHTRMHVVRGLVARGDTDDALEYIADIVPVSGAGGAGAGINDPAFGSLVDAVGAEIGALGVRIDVDPASSVERGVLGDGDIVVVTNLCRNAAEAGARTVRLLLNADAERVWGEVADDGPGIPVELLPRVFDRGFSTKPDATGTGRGIGLDVIRRTITRRDGTIEVGRSALGGTRFSFDMRTEAHAWSVR